MERGNFSSSAQSNNHFTTEVVNTNRNTYYSIVIYLYTSILYFKKKNRLRDVNGSIKQNSFPYIYP